MRESDEDVGTDLEEKDCLLDDGDEMGDSDGDSEEGGSPELVRDVPRGPVHRGRQFSNEVRYIKAIDSH